MTPSTTFALVCTLLASRAAAVDTGTSTADLCTTSNCEDGVCTFTVQLDPYAAETGYFTFEECGLTPMPIIGLTRNVTYKFIQSHYSNWYHPLGFAYFPDGAHVGVDELEPSISQSGGSCAGTNECQAPVYMKNDSVLGDYDGTKWPTQGGEDFGLDTYEPEFYYPRGDWSAIDYSVALRLTDFDYAKDIFYFCHIHKGMTGRIKVLDEEGELVSQADDPALPTDYYDVVSEYDAKCGTTGLAEYREGTGKCDGHTFVCADDKDLTEGSFGDCLRSVDCHMNYEMRTTLHPDAVVSFIHQMIPHHQNAINMAKMLLKQNALQLDGDGSDRRKTRGRRRRLDDDGGCPDCIIEEALWGIINTQAHQILQFQDWLDNYGFPEDQRCDAPYEEDSALPRFVNSKALLLALLGAGSFLF